MPPVIEDRPPPVRSADEALRWVERLAEQAEAARVELDLETDRAAAQEKYRRLLVMHGSVSGVAAALFATGHLSQVAFDAFRKRAQDVIRTRVIGGVTWRRRQ